MSNKLKYRTYVRSIEQKMFISEKRIFKIYREDVKMKILARGAEAVIYKTDKKVVKDRIKKGYRLPELDKQLRRRRTRLEARLISAASRAGVHTPKILDQSETKLVFEFIDGPKIRDWLEQKRTKKEIEEVCQKIGQEISKLHSADIIHSDLTTSNMILKDKEIYFIDFGLGMRSNRIEDKAVDIHLFKECLKSKHYVIWQLCWKAFLRGYKPQNVNEILKRLELVEQRGRYKRNL